MNYDNTNEDFCDIHGAVHPQVNDAFVSKFHVDQ